MATAALGEVTRSGRAYLSQLATLRQKGIDEDWKVVELGSVAIWITVWATVGPFLQALALYGNYRISYMKEVSLGKYDKRVANFLWGSLDLKTGTAITSGTGQLSARPLPIFSETPFSESMTCVPRTVQLERNYFKFISLHMKWVTLWSVSCPGLRDEKWEFNSHVSSRMKA